VHNSLDAVSDRDFVAEALFVCALVQVHCSRIGEEIVLWSSQEFGFVRLPDEYATGSSMMPQKKNPDVAELARGKTGRVVGDLTALLVTLKGLPLTYNRDLQEDKEPLFDALDTCAGSVAVLTGLIRALAFDTDRTGEAASDESLYATDLAEWLVRQGTPFRDAHAIVGRCVRRALDAGLRLSEVVASDPDLGPSAAALFEPGEAATRRGSGVDAIAAMISRERRGLEALAATLAGLPE
jgi:argininosuccinate lyase